MSRSPSPHKLSLQGIDGTVIGDAVRALTPRTHSRAIVAATAAVGMFGTKYNTDAPGRKNIHVHPYPWTAAGSTVIPVLRDQQGLLHLALVHNRRRDKDKKIYRLPEGYMQPKGCPELADGLPSQFQPNDEAEIKIAFHGVNHVEAYAEHPAHSAEPYDRNLFDTAMREMREEVSMSVSREQLIFLGQNEEDVRIHSITGYFLADLNYGGKVFSEKPQLISSDPDEIDQIVWGEPRNIVFSQGKFFIDTYEILPRYAEMIGHAVFEARRQELCKIAQKNISSPEDFYDLINPFLTDCNIEDFITPRSTRNYCDELGNAAELRHQKFMVLATVYAERIKDKKASTISLISRAELERLIPTVHVEQQSQCSFRQFAV